MINSGELIAEHGIGKYIRDGGEGVMFRVGKTPYAVKIAHNDEELTRARFFHQFEMANTLYGCKISVPEPIGLTRIVNPENKKIVPAFTMEYVEGQDLFQIPMRELKERVMKLRDDEVSLAERMGFVSGDAYYPGNVIWCPPKEKIYLVDFALWKRR